MDRVPRDDDGGTPAGASVPGDERLLVKGLINKNREADDRHDHPSAGLHEGLASNAEIMAILFDLEKYPNGQPTVNVGHVKNPQRNIGYLAAYFVSDTVSPGIGSDGVYRDPWGDPYIITIDLNNDGKTRDAFYRARSVSQIASGAPAGYFGSFNSYDSPAGNGDHYECNSPVMVWSAGPDQMINLIFQMVDHCQLHAWRKVDDDMSC